MTHRELRGRVPGGTIAPRFGPEGSFVARRSWRNGGVIVVAACLLAAREAPADPPAASAACACRAMPGFPSPDPAGCRDCLPPATLDRLWGTPDDPPAVSLDAIKDEHRDKHFLASDEANLHLFRDAIADAGGGFVGVGTDQAYLFIGWSRPQFAWLTDYDEWVYWVHVISGVFFDASATPAEYVAKWSSRGRDDALKLLAARFPDARERGMVERVYRAARLQAARRLASVRAACRKAGVPTYLTDPAMYDHVRAMWRSGRIRPMVGNLLGERALRGIGEAAAAAGIPIRTIYLSNAEQYWDYPPSFRANMRALNLDGRSRVLRTLASKPQNGDYRYVVQPGDLFVLWLDQPKVRAVRNIVPFIKVKDPEHIPYLYLDRRPRGL